MRKGLASFLCVFFCVFFLQFWSPLASRSDLGHTSEREMRRFYLGLRYSALATLHHAQTSTPWSTPLPCCACFLHTTVAPGATQHTHSRLRTQTSPLARPAKVMQVAPIKYKIASRSSAQRAAATKLQRLDIKLVTCAQLSEAGS